ncbi:MAG: bifunctional adenosylcobinamide kinase/adenosylcobinamide-phosphate guanylyltransferase [Helicobacteraceae bacterium]|nr:bifunctional adenosylcobinamide kinase/adenosylcobinamide-phosphate guanylyltransferase [Helicobacteraceae bacterium]
MKTLFIGGIKSGKSLRAEEFARKHAKVRPIYLATTEFVDEEMALRIKRHKEQRGKHFITYEEPLHLHNAISVCKDIVLVECLSMWINNMLYHGHSYEEMLTEIEKILALPQDIVFVLNDVGSCVIPENELAREFIDISGRLSQIIACECESVFHTIAGIARQIK